MRLLVILLALLLALIMIPPFYRSFSQIKQSEWPSKAAWQELNERVGGRLRPLISPVEACQGEACSETIQEIDNPFVLTSHAWGTQSTGWYNGWSYAASPYAIEAETTQDLVEAVQFANRHHVKLVIKGTGHDYLGRSSSPNSLLVWTHNMREVTAREAFVVQGAPEGTKPVTAMTAEAGAMWLHAYDEITNKHERYVQGAGCTTVGVAGGFLQGGGFGQFARQYGTCASTLLEAEVVLASGEVVIANAYQYPDLFWALKGGGGGTFGIVSKVTLQTFELPSYVGAFATKITASNDAAYERLIEQFLHFYREALKNPTWGERVYFNLDNTLQIAMSFQGIDREEVEATWAPFKAWIEEQADVEATPFKILDFPADKYWNLAYLQKYYPNLVIPYKEGDKRAFYWKGDREQVLSYWFSYESRWMPSDLFDKQAVGATAAKIFQASRYFQVAFHFNKAMAGAAEEARERVKQTSMNPSVLDASALAIIGYFEHDVFPGLKGYEPDINQGKEKAQQAHEAANILFALAPNAGTYPNESDYFQENWQIAFWGDNYPKLLKIKQKYDPDHLFMCHHCVGGE